MAPSSYNHDSSDAESGGNVYRMYTCKKMVASLETLYVPERESVFVVWYL
jgi:hypothetical protein